MSFRGFSRPNATSGMGVADQTKDTFLELKRKKVYRYVIYRIDEKKREVVVEKTGAPAETYDDFAASLPETDCRYAVYDFDFVTSENCQKSKIFFIAWCPSSSRIRAKMLYATSKDRLRRELDGIHYEIRATDPTEMDLEVLRIVLIEQFAVLAVPFEEITQLCITPCFIKLGAGSFSHTS